jgi:hypothetical protein
MVLQSWQAKILFLSDAKSLNFWIGALVDGSKTS